MRKRKTTSKKLIARRKAVHGRKSHRGKRRLEADLEHFQELLLSERERLLAELKSVGSGYGERRFQEHFGELSDIDDHPADIAGELFERDQDILLGEQIRMLLEKVERALAKIKDNTYGICENCGGKIEKARLKANPYASLCMKCVLKSESA